ncbi:hypothetical protein EUX98_g306 [Antrodiella citrinella]|uniref:CMP/dCMP-type deaminase domain-containing protein n=1 Tax=Antrodiella citrinella TaxID=2447956 RepID=A0A4S4N624_9APHY|nr:hypothetical protein EUX98_g306 [Antrodiella citrinella]
MYVTKDDDVWHMKWMKRALAMAEEALETGEVPVGCVFVRENVIIAQARNRTNELGNVCWLFGPKLYD